MQLNSLIGKKVEQKSGFLENGRRVPLTGVLVSGNIVTQIKTTAKEGYNSVQLGFNTGKKIRKSIKNHAQKAFDTNSNPIMESSKSASVTPKLPTFFKEIRTEDIQEFTTGIEINPNEVFAAGDVINVTGISKGKGWAGGVKRYGFRGGPKTHGQSDRHRAPGSIGQGTTPGRVYRGKKMAGRMGSDTVTVKNLEVIEITADGVMFIKGLIPGNLNGLVVIKKVGENKKFVPLYREIVEETVNELIEAKPDDAEVNNVVESVKEADQVVTVEEENAAPIESAAPDTVPAEESVEEKPEVKDEKKESEVVEDAK